MKQRRPLTSALVVATLLLGLLAVVSLAAGGRAPLGDDGGEGRAVPTAFWDYVFSATIVLFVVAMPVVVWLFFMSRSLAPRRRGGLHRDMLVLVYVALACVTIVALSRLYGEEPRLSEPEPGRPEMREQQDDGPRREPEFRWLPLLVVAGGAVVLVAYQGARWRGQGTLDPAREGELLDELAALVEDTLDDLHAEPDPRRAVISAYARMERVLALFGMPRRPNEAPLEYLHAIEPDLQPVPGAARLVFELTQLYERAKFSSHEIDVEMAEHAIATLLALRAELLVPA